MMSDELADVERESDVAASLQTRLPLNSKPFTKNHLRRLASKLEVPTGAAADELRLMIDGKLLEAGRDVRTIQVLLASTHPNSEFF